MSSERFVVRNRESQSGPSGIWFFLGLGIGCLLLLNGFLISLIALGILKWQGATWVPDWIAVMENSGRTNQVQNLRATIEGPIQAHMTGTLQVAYPEGIRPVVIQIPANSAGSSNANIGEGSSSGTSAGMASAGASHAIRNPMNPQSLSADDAIVPRPKSLKPRASKIASSKRYKKNFSAIRTRNFRRTREGHIQIDGSMFMPGNQAPAYPMVSRLKREEGTVVLELDINPDGTTSDVKVARTSGSRLLDRAAVTAEQRWLYLPGYAGRARKAVSFQLVGSPEEVPSRYKNLSLADME